MNLSMAHSLLVTLIVGGILMTSSGGIQTNDEPQQQPPPPPPPDGYLIPLPPRPITPEHLSWPGTPILPSQADRNELKCYNPVSISISSFQTSGGHRMMTVSIHDTGDGIGCIYQAFGQWLDDYPGDVDVFREKVQYNPPSDGLYGYVSDSYILRYVEWGCNVKDDYGWQDYDEPKLAQGLALAQHQQISLAMMEAS